MSGTTWVAGALAAVMLLGGMGCATRPSCGTAGTAAGHPPDATEFAGHWYKVFDGEDLTWAQKRDKCREQGGYLCCIESEAEQAFVARLADGRYLSLGATDEAREDAWQWVNGAAWKYECWMGGQPNNYGGDEHYLATYDGGDWVDVAAEGGGFWMPTGYICEWER
jgi:hypothetical protein